LSGRGLCDELITRPEESYRLCCVVVCDLETSRIGAPYISDISNLRVNEDWRIVDKLLLKLPVTKTTLLRPLIPKEGGSTLLRNVRNYLPHCTIHLKRLEYFFINNQLDAQFFFHIYVYFYSLHVSGSHVPIIRRINCINTTSGICHSV